MAIFTQTFTLNPADITHDTANFKGWTKVTPVDVIEGLTAGDAVIQFERVLFRTNTGVNNGQYRLFFDPSGESGSGHDLIEEFEEGIDSLTFTQGDNTLVVPGPNNEANATTDDTEAYIWDPGVSDVADAVVFFFTTLDTSQDLTLTLKANVPDPVPPPVGDQSITTNQITTGFSSLRLWESIGEGTRVVSVLEPAGTERYFASVQINSNGGIDLRFKSDLDELSAQFGDQLISAFAQSGFFAIVYDDDNYIIIELTGADTTEPYVFVISDTDKQEEIVEFITFANELSPAAVASDFTLVLGRALTVYRDVSISFDAGTPTVTSAAESFAPVFRDVSVQFNAGTPEVVAAAERIIYRDVSVQFIAGIPKVEAVAQAVQTVYRDVVISFNAGTPSVAATADKIVYRDIVIEYSAGTPTVTATAETDTHVASDADISVFDFDMLEPPGDIVSTNDTYKSQGRYIYISSRLYNAGTRVGGAVPDPWSNPVKVGIPAITGEDGIVDVPEPNKPVMVGSAQGRNVHLRWTRQPDLINLIYHELQVAEDSNGPWYEPDLTGHGLIWRLDVENDSAEVSGHAVIHIAIPLDGDPNAPSARTLYYRIRRVVEGGNNGPWSDVIMATAEAISLVHITGTLVHAALLSPDVYDNLGLVGGSLLAHWPLDDTVTGIDPVTAGVARDIANDNNLLIESPLVVGNVGTLKQALSFSGAVGSISKTSGGITNTNTWNALSFVFWVRFLSAQPNTVVQPFSYYAGDYLATLKIDTADFTYTMEVQAGNVSYTAQEVWQDIFTDEWHPIAAIFDAENGTASLWIDGLQVIEEAQLRDSGGNAIPTGEITKGHDVSIGGAVVAGIEAGNINGRIDEVRLYSFALEIHHVRYFLANPQGPFSPVVDPKTLPDDIIAARMMKANSVLANTIAAAQIFTRHLIAEAVTTGKLAAAAVTSEKITANAIIANLIDSNAIIARHIMAGEITADKMAANVLRVGTTGNVVIDDEGIVADMIAANAINLGSATVFGTLTAEHIESDVINVRRIWSGSVIRTSGGSGGTSPVTRTTDTTIFDDLDIEQFPYIMILAKISNFNFTHIIPRSTGQRVLYNLDTTRAFEIWYNVGTDSLIIDRSIEHEEFLASDVGDLTVFAVFGVTYPDAEYTPPPDNTAVPSVPSSLSSTETAGTSTWSVAGNWVASSNANGYIIEYQSRTPGSAWPTTVTTVMTSSLSRTLYSSLAQNLEYRFRVQAFNDNNTSTFSVWYNDSVGNIVAPPPVLPDLPMYNANMIPINPVTGTSMSARVRNLTEITNTDTVTVHWRRSTSPTTWTNWVALSVTNPSSFTGITGHTFSLTDNHVGGRWYEIAIRGNNDEGSSNWRVIQFQQTVGGANFTFVWRNGK